MGNVDVEALAKSRQVLNEALNREEIFWRQKSRVTWLKEGDRATKFFMASTVTRRRRNYIQILKDESGIVYEEIGDIAQKFLERFSNIFSVSKERIPMRWEKGQFMENTGLLEGEINVMPMEEEIIHALCSMGVEKAPGPDGLPVAFFRAHWDMIREYFIKMIRHFFSTKSLSAFINDTNLVLIPKKENPSSVNDYRPIALCNVIYKCISKIIALRFRTVLPAIITPNQTVFVRGRFITENTAVARELIHSMAKRSGQKGYMMIKLDMEKAYDRMNWDFIREVLSLQGAKEPLLGWIMKCIQIKKMNIMINGTQQGSFTPQCGLRQGDPLSPALFIIADDILSHLILKAAEKGKIKGFKVSRNAKPITHLMFADDIMLVGQASEKEAVNFLKCIRKYCKWSGQAVNF